MYARRSNKNDLGFDPAALRRIIWPPPALQSPSENPITLPPPRRKRRWLRIFAILLVLLALGLVWLNGPGLRWLGPLAARHFLPKAGLSGDLRIEGSLSHGFSIAGLHLTGDGPLANLTLDRATPHYRWSELVRGRLDGLTVENLHAVVDLDAKPTAPDPAKPADSEKSEPLDLRKLAETVRTARGYFLPVGLDLGGISVEVRKDRATLLSLAPTSIRHASGADQVRLEIGAITDATGRAWPAQSATLAWSETCVTLDRLDPHPSVGLSDLALQLPATEAPSLETRIRLDEAVFALTTTPGFANASLALESGSLRADRVAKSFGVEIPASATLTSFSLDAANLLPSPLAATANLAIGIDNATYQEWNAEEIAIGSVIEADHATLTVAAKALGTTLHADSTVALIRSGDSIRPGPLTGTFQVPAVHSLLRQIALKLPDLPLKADAPESDLSGKFAADFDNLKPKSATAEASLAPADPALATPVTISGRYEPDHPINGHIALAGLALDGEYNLEGKTYQGTLGLTDFSTTPLEPWLAVAGVKLPGTAGLTAKWVGSGDLAGNTHRGMFALPAANWSQPGQPAIAAAADLDYEWPGNVRIASLKATAEKQTVSLTAALRDNALTLDNLLWTDGENEIASGSASVPVPPDFSKWREFLTSDTRPIAVAIETRALSLGLLKPWLPAAEKLDPRATGQLKLHAAGTLAAPEIDLAVDCLDLRSPENPKLPPADLKFSLKAGGERVSVDASVTAPEYPPAILTASLPFRPKAWADDPESITAENLTAKLDLPRLDLSRFTTLVPSLKRLSGFVTGTVTASGPLTKPEANGTIRLENASATLADPSVPPIQNAAAEVNFTLKQISLKNLRASIAGGTLDGSGALVLTDNKPSSLDFRLRGSQLPLLRNDMLILRANADLRLAGPWESAALTGTVAAVDSLFYRDIELLPIGKPFTTPSAASLPKLDARPSTGKATAAIPAPFGAWKLNLAVKTQDPFLIRGNLATGQVDVALKVIGNLSDPKLDGTATISDFAATLPFSTLKIRTGTVRFTPASGFDPILEIRGTAEPRPYRVAAFVYGKASDPQIMLTSVPPLPETEIMTLLATGTTTEGLEDTGAATNRAIQLFAEEVRRGRVRYTKQLRPLLGVLDRVDFSLKETDPYSTGSMSTATISLTDKLFVSAGMGEQGNTRVMGIWRISFK